LRCADSDYRWFFLDDFGSRLSSSRYLATLPVDFVKIDGQFIRDMDRSAVHRAITRSIHDIAAIMGKQIVCRVRRESGHRQ